MILLFLMFFLLVFMVTAMALYFHLKYHRPSQSQIEKDIQQLKSHIRPLLAGLKPWPANETDLLCTHSHTLKKRTSWKDLHMGVLKTIYDEDIVAWASYAYKSEKPNDLYLLRYSGWNEQIILRIRKEEAYLFRGESHIATLSTDWAFTDPRQNKVICRITPQSDTDLYELTACGRNLAIMQFRGASDQANPRVFQWLDTRDEEEIFAVRLFAAVWLLLMQRGAFPRRTES